jgi:site-specific DNA-adenine methylase
MSATENRILNHIKECLILLLHCLKCLCDDLWRVAKGSTTKRSQNKDLKYRYSSFFCQTYPFTSYLCVFIYFVIEAGCSICRFVSFSIFFLPSTA